MRTRTQREQNITEWGHPTMARYHIPHTTGIAPTRAKPPIHEQSIYHITIIRSIDDRVICGNVDIFFKQLEP